MQLSSYSLCLQPRSRVDCALPRGHNSRDDLGRYPTVGTARLHCLPFRQELHQYLAPGGIGKQRDEFLDEQNRAAFISEYEDLAVQLPECLYAFHAARAKRLAVGLVHV